ncbi:hypothetical protein NMG60_11035102 [Bertholletia excelsa]
MATISGVSLSAPRVLARSSDSPKAPTLKCPGLNNPWKSSKRVGADRMYVRPVAAAPESLSDKVADSVKKAEEACDGDPAGGECVTAWDEVEELSAAASHARDRKKESDPLENYCKDNPETDECRTYDN